MSDKDLMMCIRPHHGGQWLIVGQLSDLDGAVSDDKGDLYEVKFVRMTKEEQEALPEFDGW